MQNITREELTERSRETKTRKEQTRDGSHCTQSNPQSSILNQTFRLQMTIKAQSRSGWIDESFIRPTEQVTCHDELLIK